MTSGALIQGGGFSEVEWAYLIVLDMGLADYEAAVLLADDICTENLSSNSGPGWYNVFDGKPRWFIRPRW